jgi:hypothetical protein
VYRLGQWHRADQQGDPEMGERHHGRVAVHRHRQAAAERLHRVIQSLRDECPNEESFDSPADARRKLALWR